MNPGSLQSWGIGAALGALLLAGIAALVWRTDTRLSSNGAVPAREAAPALTQPSPGSVPDIGQSVQSQAQAGAPSAGSVPAAPGGPSEYAKHTRPPSEPDTSAGVRSTRADSSAGHRPDQIGAGRDLPVGRPDAPSLSSIQQELQALTAAGRQPTPAEVEQVLAKLQANQGSAVVAGINLETLRANLRIAEQMRMVAAEVQHLAAQPTPENTARMQQLSAQLLQLQGQLQADVRAPSARAGTQP